MGQRISPPPLAAIAQRNRLEFAPLWCPLCKAAVDLICLYLCWFDLALVGATY